MHTVILAGGQSRRMGRDKARLPWGGETLLQSLIDRFAPFGPVAVCVDRPGHFGFSGASELCDPYPGQGPLNGVIAGLRWSGGEPVFLCAVDLPFADPTLARTVFDALDGCDVCLLQGDRGPEPLFAAYGPACPEAAETALRQGRRSMRVLLDAVHVRHLDGTTPEARRALRNVNVPEDYAALL